jgi:hypothetical protein
MKLVGCATIMMAAAMLGGCANFLDAHETSGPPDRAELDRIIREACPETPNTFETRECRRRVEDSWRVERKPGPLERVSLAK